MSVKGFVRAEFKQSAKEKLNGNWTAAIAVSIFYVVIVGIYLSGQVVINTQAEKLGYVTDPMLAFQALKGAFMTASIIFLIGSALNCAFQLAASKFFLNVASKSSEVGIGDFLGYFRYVLKAIGAGLWQTLWIGIWVSIFMIPAAVAFGAGGTMLTGSAITGESSPIGIVAMGIGVVLYILGIVVSIIKSISYSQMYFVLANEDSIGVLRSMRISKVLTKNYLGDIFVLGLSFILWYLLASFTFGLAYIYVFPYTMTTFAETYIFLRNRAFEEGSLEPEEFGLRKVGGQAPSVGVEIQGTFPTEAPHTLPQAEETFHQEVEPFHQEVEPSPTHESDSKYE